MNFFSLAFNNIKKRFASYLIYLVSAVFAVTIFSIFCSMYFNPQFSQYRFGVGKMALLFKFSAVAVLLFSAVFILYANRFFVKTRKKEIAIYSLLGMKKGQIGRMLFYENMMIGVIAITGGVLFGTLLSRFFCMIMLHLMKQIPKVKMYISGEAIIITILVFFIIFAINSFNAYLIIYRYQLIELFSASKEGEKLPKFSVLGGIASILILVAGYAYGLSLDTSKGGLKQLPEAGLVIVLVILGTILFFCNFIPMIVVSLKGNKKLYYRASNYISLSQIVYRINANSRMLSMIAIFSAITITMISATAVLYKAFEKTGTYYIPFHFLCEGVDDEMYQKVVTTIDQIGEVKLLSANRFTLLNAQMQNPAYKVDHQYDVAPGEVQTEVSKVGDSFVGFVMSASDYKMLIQNLQVPTGKFNNQATDFPDHLRDDECYFIDGNMNADYSKKLAGEISLNLGGTTQKYKIAGVSLHKYLGVFKTIRKTTLVLNDKTYQVYKQKLNKNEMTSFMGLMFDEPMRSKRTVDEISNIVPENQDVMEMMEFKQLNFYDLNSVLYAQYGAYLFIGTFLGILFLLASGSIMYYKQIIEAQEEVVRYEILEKIGMTKLEIRKSISKQLAAIFAMPLLVGLLHSLFALIVYNHAMMFMAEDMVWAYKWEATVCLIFVLIYYFYYRLSVNSYMKIIWSGK